MAKTPEAKVKEKITTILKRIGAYYFFPATGGYGRSGVPDIIGCHNGQFFGIEVKAGKNKPTKLQLQQLAAISKSGGVALVINEDNIDALNVLGVNPKLEDKLTDALVARGDLGSTKAMLSAERVEYEYEYFTTACGWDTLTYADWISAVKNAIHIMERKQ